MKNPIALVFLSAALLLLGACSHNDQRNCTTDCNIGAGTTVISPGYGIVAAPVYHRRFMAPSLYHPYRGYGRHHGGSGFRLHMGGSVVIR